MRSPILRKKLDFRTEFLLSFTKHLIKSYPDLKLFKKEEQLTEPIQPLENFSNSFQVRELFQDTKETPWLLSLPVNIENNPQSIPEPSIISQVNPLAQPFSEQSLVQNTSQKVQPTPEFSSQGSMALVGQPLGQNPVIISQEAAQNFQKQNLRPELPKLPPLPPNSPQQKALIKKPFQLKKPFFLLELPKKPGQIQQQSPSQPTSNVSSQIISQNQSNSLTDQKIGPELKVTPPLEKINPMIKDPTVLSIECPGPDKNILVNKGGIIQTTQFTLTKTEIDSIMNEISKQIRIPLMPGVFKAVFGNLLVTAVISEFVGTRFIIQKRMPFKQPSAETKLYKPI